MLSNGFGPSAPAVLRTEVMLASSGGSFVFIPHVLDRKAEPLSRLQGRTHVSLLWLFNVASTFRIMLLMLLFRHQHVAMCTQPHMSRRMQRSLHLQNVLANFTKQMTDILAVA